MTKKTKFPPPKEDVPAWFMTYSDVVTLLMTFFILLLTFASQEPEKFDQVDRPISSNQAATGRTGIESNKQAKEAWVSRIRPPSARIATRGAEMPPITQAPVKESFGKGLNVLKPDEQKHNELESHYFDVEINQLFNQQGEITSQGEMVLGALAGQLRDLPFQSALQFSDPVNSERVTLMMVYLFDYEKIRPGQLGMTLVRDDSLTKDRVRILVKRFLVKPS